MPRTLRVLPLGWVLLLVLSACAGSVRPTQVTPASVAGCYLVRVVGSAEVTGVFPDSIGLGTVPSFDTTGFYGVSYMVSQAQRVQLLVWRMVGNDSLEVVARVLFKDIDVKARLKADGFVGTVVFTDASHSTTGSVIAKRSYCMQFGIKRGAA